MKVDEWLLKKALGIGMTIKSNGLDQMMESSSTWSLYLEQGMLTNTQESVGSGQFTTVT